MPLRFNSAPPTRLYDVLEVKVGEKWPIRIGSDLAHRLETDLHWLPSQRRTVPCLHEDCPWCHLPARPVIFAPIEFFQLQTKLWIPAILCASLRMRALLAEDVAGKVYQLSRCDRDNAPIKWMELERHRSNLQFRGFELEASLKRMWGEYCNYKIVRPKLAAEEGAA